MNTDEIAKRIRTIDEEMLQPFLRDNMYPDVDEPIRKVADALRDLWYEIEGIENPFIITVPNTVKNKDVQQVYSYLKKKLKNE